jgi:GT2 family glycosyltransferase
MDRLLFEIKGESMISVVIVSYKVRDILRQCLRALFDQSEGLEIEVFVVDNASGDGSAEMVAAEFPQVRLLANDSNRGFAAANNQAFALARGDFVLLLNPDAFVRPGALVGVRAFMERTPECGLCGGRLLDSKGCLMPSARRFPGALSRLLTLSGLSSRYRNSAVFNRHDFGGFAHDRVLEVDWVPGTFTLIRKPLLDQLEGFDERFFIYYEETDLCLRAKALGWKIYFIPDVEVEHIGGASSKARDDQDYNPAAAQISLFSLRSACLYHYKHGGLMAVLANIGLEILWNLLRILWHCFRRSAESQAKVKGARNAIAMLRQALKDTDYGRLSPPTPW